jgi:pimeloyl-ACP methyl ester carboxylesterase
MRFLLQLFLIPLVLFLMLTACSAPEIAPTAVASATATSIPSPEPTVAPTATAVSDTAVSDTAVADTLPAAVEYNLGEAIIIQDRFPEDSRFRNMPVQLNGLIAVPPGEDGPYPVVVVLHGTHPGCPVNDMGVDVWPCGEDERPNYQGFAYLLSHLAAQGYVALSININAENTFGFGEPSAGERLEQILDLHMDALAAAADGGQNEFGVALDGRADVNRLALIGHSRGGELANWLANEQGWAAPDALQELGFGPVDGLILLAPAIVFFFPQPSLVPLSVVIPSCDGDVVTQDGQTYYDETRLVAENPWATSIWLEQANHNYFNETLLDDSMGRFDRPDCEPILAETVQRDWLTSHATDFLTAVFSQDAAAVTEAQANLGLDVTAAPVQEVAGLPALVSSLSSGSNRQTILLPATEEELTTHLLGGAVLAEGMTTHFCPSGFYNSESLPGSEPCRRNYVTVPGQPDHAVLTWDSPDAALRFTLPAESGDVRDYAALSLRAAVDPMSPLNAADAAQAFSVQLTDSAGNSSIVTTQPDEPALRFPPGLMLDIAVIGTDQVFSGRVPLTTIRLPLSAFTGVDLSQISEVALLFDQTPSGALFVSDVEWVRP